MNCEVMLVGGSFPMPMGGGSVNYVYRLLSEFKGIPLVVYTSSYGNASNVDFDQDFGHIIIRSSFCHHVLGSYNESIFKRAFSYLIEGAQIVYNIVKFRPKLVYFTEISLPVLSYVIARLFVPFKLGLFTYSEEIQQVKDRWIYRRIISKVLHDADVVLTVCDYTHKLLNHFFNVDDKILKIIPPIPYEGESPNREEKGIGESLVILTVGRLCERKGHKDVIDVMVRLHHDFPNVKYEIIGTGEYGDVIANHIKQTASEDFVFMRGKLTDRELDAAYSRADIFVMHHKLLPNGDTEGCPTVFLEASWHRLPVVGGEAGGVSDAIIDGETGFICHIGTDELYERIRLLIENKELRNKMGEKGYKYARNYTMTKQSRLFLEYTNKLLLGDN